MSTNNKRSYTEYNVQTPTTNFAIGFENFATDSRDTILVTLNGVDVSTLGYTVQRANDLTIVITPAITEGTVRLTRETLLDEPFHKFTAGALFTAKSMDENFAQVIHAQQEVGDTFTFVQENINGVLQATTAAKDSALAAAARADVATDNANTATTEAIDATTEVDIARAATEAATAATNTARAATITATDAANLATSKADTATEDAIIATMNADTARTNTLLATTNAITATTNANAATSAANAATSTLIPVRDAAVAATDSANLAASEATTATGLANTATGLANTATSNADAATARADTATGKANTATANANTAASGANTAKATTVVATDNANTAASAANAAADRVATVEAGKAAEITSVTANTVAAGTPASVTLGGTSQFRTFAFNIPAGATGTAGTISSATASTGAAGTAAKVTLGGTSTNRTFAFTIPRGDTGVLPNFYTSTTLEAPNTYIGADGTYKRSNDPLNASTRKVGTAAGNLVERGANGYPTNNNAIGVGQTWQIVTISRTANTVYTNSTGRPITVMATFVRVTGDIIDCFIDNAKVSSIILPAAGVTLPMVFIVPAGSTYKIETETSLFNWAELR